jgi:hypothetical protein
MPALSEDELSALAKSIEEEGIKDPLLISMEGEVIDGNHRMDIALEKGIKEVPFVAKEYKNEFEKQCDALKFQIARRNLKAYQLYTLIYNFWKEYGLRQGEGGDHDKGKGARVASLTKKDISEVFAVSHRTIGNAIEYGKNAEFLKKYGPSSNEESVNFLAQKKGVNAVKARARDVFHKDLEEAVRESVSDEIRPVEPKKNTVPYEKWDVVDISKYVYGYTDKCLLSFQELVEAFQNENKGREELRQIWESMKEAFKIYEKEKDIKSSDHFFAWCIRKVK